MKKYLRFSFVFIFVVLGCMSFVATAAEETTSDTSFTITPLIVMNNAFSFSWESEYVFTNCLLHIWTNRLEGASEGTKVWSEGFGQTEGVESARDEITSETIGNYTDTAEKGNGFSCFMVFPSKDDGALRIGNSNTKGWLQTPALNIEGQDLMLKIRAKRYTEKCGRDMPVDLISGNVTNRIAIFSLTDDLCEYTVTHSFLKQDRLVFHSTTNRKDDGRISLDSIEIWQGVREATSIPETNRVSWVGLNSPVVVSNLPSVQLFAQLEGFGETSNMLSNVLELDLSNPPKLFWRTSSFRKNARGENTRKEDFGWVTNVTKQTKWSNGSTITGFYASQNDEALEDIKLDTKITTLSGLFASYTNKSDFVWSISLRAVENKSTELEVRILNDKQKTLKDITLEYDEFEWLNSHAKNATALTNAYALAANVFSLPSTYQDVVVGQISSKVVVPSEEMNDKGYTKKRTRVKLPVVLNPGEVFYYRWIAPKKSSSSMLGVGDLTVMLEWQSGFSLILR